VLPLSVACDVCAQNAVYRANVRTTRFSRPVAHCKGPERVAPGRTEVLNYVPMVVPPIPPSRLDGCAIVNIDYELQVGLSLSVFNSFYARQHNAIPRRPICYRPSVRPSVCPSVRHTGVS